YLPIGFIGHFVECRAFYRVDNGIDRFDGVDGGIGVVDLQEDDNVEYERCDGDSQYGQHQDQVESDQLRHGRRDE
ncbi:hypothetical protein PFISCL1PPCAC_23834, partial [Pristionchus fissidentatus]